tara:strand:- start:130 stop:1179 length:1050 start_codon:yes stop_codon:yes gene_type:complete
MTFFDKKEEILEIKLSSFGKQKIAAGKFKPVYYAFFDDDILYDAARAGLTEDNNNIEPRIQENTPSMRVQTSFTDLELRVMKQTHDVLPNGTYQETNVMDLKNDPSVFQDTNGLRDTLPLGNSQLSNQHVASWNVHMLEGAYKSYTSTTQFLATPVAPFRDQKPTINIPQIEVDLVVQPTLVEKDFIGLVDPETGRYVSTNPINDNFIRLHDDYILLDVEELNVDLLNDSFSLEVYEIIPAVETEGSIRIPEHLEPKLFRKEIQPIVDGILLDQNEIDAQISNAEINHNFAEYFFNISVDDNIDNKTKYEKIVAREMKGNIFDNNVGFEEYSQTPGGVLYTSDNDGGEC